jgi:hypothetical protein
MCRRRSQLSRHVARHSTSLVDHAVGLRQQISTCLCSFAASAKCNTQSRTTSRHNGFQACVTFILAAGLFLFLRFQTWAWDDFSVPSPRSDPSDAENSDTFLNALPSETTGRCEPTFTEPAPRDPSYVFLHLHKTAGNNLKVALFGFAKRNNLNLYHTCRPTNDGAILRATLFGNDKKPGDFDCNLNEFVNWSKQVRSSFDFVVGHQYMGIHRFMPERDVRYFTFLRHPIARKVSHYAHFEACLGNSLIDERDKLKTYLILKNRNYMTKRLAATPFLSEFMLNLRSGLIDSEQHVARAVLQDAKRNIRKHFFFVGVQERYSESLCVLSEILNTACYTGQRGVHAKWLNASRIAHSHENERGTTDRRIEQLGNRVRADALSAEWLDLDLYHDAQKMLDSHLLRYPGCREA